MNMFFDTATMTFQSEDTSPPSYYPLSDEYYGQLLDGRGQGNTIELDQETGGPILVPIPAPTWQELQSPIEDQWRKAQMTRIANQLLMLEDGDPDAEPGTARQWMDYRIALRKWVDGGNPGFPDATKRPIAPQ
jgi:hypothetical protein